MQFCVILVLSSIVGEVNIARFLTLTWTPNFHSSRQTVMGHILLARLLSLKQMVVN